MISGTDHYPYMRFNWRKWRSYRNSATWALPYQRTGVGQLTAFLVGWPVVLISVMVPKHGHWFVFLSFQVQQ